jgi:hypothetical protein
MLGQDYFNSLKHFFQYSCVMLLLELFQMSCSLPHSESVKFSVYYGKFYHVPYRICSEVNISTLMEVCLYYLCLIHINQKL